MVVVKGFSPNEYFEWEESHPLCSNALSPSGSVMIKITITITMLYDFNSMNHPNLMGARRSCGQFLNSSLQKLTKTSRHVSSSRIYLLPSRQVSLLC